MLKSIEYTVQFNHTGRTLHEQIKFERGFGAVIGPNESGKSMVLEMVRWLLFGSAALRGSAVDYIKIHGALEFSVKGVEYFLTRAHNGATLRRGKARDEIATGTKPVNAKIIEVLGFGLPVFDIACAANQNALLALGEMKPTERKRLVDSVIGLGVIEDLSKSAGEESNALNRRAEDIYRNLKQPIEPIKPPQYVSSNMLRDELNGYLAQKSELDRLRGWLSVEKKKIPKPECDIPLSAEDLQDLVDNQTQLRMREKDLSSRPQPRYTKNELGFMKLQNQGYANKVRLKGLLDREVHLAKEQIECPSCGHQWSLDEQTLNQIRAEISTLKTSNLFSDKPAELLDSHIEREMAKLEGWDASTQTELQEIRKTLDKQPDFREMLIKRQRYELELSRYEDEVQSYDEWHRQYQANLMRVNELEVVLGGIDDVQAGYEAAREYENHMSFYVTVKEEYDNMLGIAGDLKSQSEDWAKARIALSLLCTKIKQHLVPSLNRVASHLLKEMTGGQRQTIVIDEDFNISVDGQPLSTLSGSGMAIANLAIRIGLGQVLTNNIMSLFMADEIDASMDDTRAKATEESLKNLSNSISQILLVTHKSPVADYYIKLGESNE